MTRRLTDEMWSELLEVRLRRPESIGAALAARSRRELLGPSGHLFIVAADHPARGANGIPGDPMAMADRRDYLERVLTCLDDPRVDGVMASVDVLDDLAVLPGAGGWSALDGKVVIGSMNRGGLLGSSFELDDRFTSYDAEALAEAGFDGGKMLLRIDGADPGTLPTLVAVAEATSQLAARGLMAMIEPLPYRRVEGRATLVKDDDALIRAIGVASALGTSSAHTWMKLPAWGDVERVMRATSMPTLLLGGAPSGDPEADRAEWARALAVPHVRGYTIGRSLLYPPDGDVAAAVSAAADVLDAAVAAKTRPDHDDRFDLG